MRICRVPTPLIRIYNGEQGTSGYTTEMLICHLRNRNFLTVGEIIDFTHSWATIFSEKVELANVKFDSGKTIRVNPLNLIDESDLDKWLDQVEANIEKFKNKT